MKLDRRVLLLSNPQLVGSDVDLLHEELAQLGDPYRQLLAQDVDRQGRRLFGANTRKAVTAFQEANRWRLQEVIARSLDSAEEVRWSGVWGTVDPATAQVINEQVALATQPFIVRGRVEYEDGTPAEGIRVAVYDRDIGTFRQKLGGDDTGATNAGGIFPEVRYAARNHSRGEGRPETSADLVFELDTNDHGRSLELLAIYRQRGLPGAPEEVLVSDPILGFAAQPLETVRLVVHRSDTAEPSEYELLMGALEPLLARRITPDQFDEARHRDLTFAAQETHASRTLIETVSQAWALAKATGLAPELFYGLLRHEPPTAAQPMPANLPGLLAFGRAPWETKLLEAFTLKLIPASMRNDLPRWLDQLQHHRAKDALQMRADDERIALGDLLRHAGVPGDRHVAFADLLTGHVGVADALWKNVADELKWTPAEIQRVQGAVELSDAVLAYQPLLAKLFESGRTASARSLADWARQKLDDLVGHVGAPSDMPGDTAAQRRSAYADGIESRLREAYPAAYAAKALRSVRDHDIQRAGNWLHGMLSQTRSLPGGVPAFDLVGTPATAYLREHGDSLFTHETNEQRTLLSSQLKRVQRVFQLSATPEQMPLLFEEQLESAHQIVRWSHEHFVEQYGARLGGPEAAAAVHSKARYIHGALLNLYLDVRKIYPAVQPAFEKLPDMHVLGASVRPPTLNQLFGNDDQCICASCLSVLSPAAYFVDLLQFLDVPQPGSTTKKLQVLLSKRPDLAHIQLTCDNTNTRIPYVDLVNEILASYVAHETPFAYNDPKDGVVSGTVDELRVNPISLTDAAAQAEAIAYEKLQAAVFPFNLPYHHWLEVTRLYLGHFDIRRAQLMRRFQTDDDLDTEMAIAAEALRLSPQEFEVVTGAHFDGSSSTLAPTLASLYGFVETAAPATAPANHVAPEFTIGDLRAASLRALQNFLKNVSTSPGLTPAIRSAIKVIGDFSSATAAAATLNAVQAFRTDHALPAAGGTDGAFWGALDAEGHPPLSVMLSHAPMFLRQTGIRYEDLVGLVTSKSFNPAFNERVYFSNIGITPEEIMAFVQSGAAAPPPAMQAKVTAAGITQIEFLKKVAAFHSVLVLDSPPDALCDIDQTTIRHIDGSLLTPLELLRLQQWIRLWKKLGWPLHDFDLVVSIYPLSDPFTLILRLADIAQLLDELDVPVEQLLALWAPIDTWDERSLYERLFRSKTAQSLDPLFTLDPLRREIDEFVKKPGTPPLLADHEPLLLAAFHLDAADLGLLLATLPDGNLNLHNVSELYACVVLARSLDLTISEWLALRGLSGADPLKPPAGEIESSATAFVRIVRAVQASPLTVTQLNHLLRNRRDSMAVDLQTPEQQRDTLGTIRVGLEDIQRDYMPADDPEGDVLVRQLGAVLRADLAATLGRMITARQSYASSLIGFPALAAFPAAVAQKISYDGDREALRFAGVMTTSELSTLTSLSFVSTLPPAVQVPFTDAVKALFAMPQQFAEQELFDLMDSAALMTLLRSASSLAPDGRIDRAAVATKVAAVLVEVRRVLCLNLVKRTLADLFHFEDATVAKLLQDEAMLVDLNHGGTHTAIEDFLALEGDGIQATYYANTTLKLPAAAQTLEAEIRLDAATPLPAGVGPGPFSVRWTGHLFSPLTEDFTLLLRVRDAVRVWLNGVLVLNEWKAQPETGFLVETKLRKGSVNALTIEHAHFAGSPAFHVSWRSPSTALSPVPTTALYTEDRIQTLAGPLARLEKIAVVVAGLRLTPPDIDAVSRLGYFDWNGIPIVEPAPAAVTALFERWTTLLRFTEVRNRLPRKSGAFAALLGSQRLDEALDAYTALTGALRSDVQEFADAATRHPFNTATLVYDSVAPDVRDLQWWSRLRDSCLNLTRAGCSAAQLVAWGVVKDVTRTTPAPPVTNWYAMSLAPAARLSARATGEDLKRLVKAKYEEAQWRVVARTINDTLRMTDRDGLTGYVLAMPAILDLHYETADELFEFFLIDVKMDPCMETSRIQQGIATIQLFLQRALMGLMENETPPVMASSIDRHLYERMQTYALWHPSREILIHTENYIRWDLLDRKSEAFRQFEQDLRKQDLTQVENPTVPRGQWAERAFMNFLEKLDEVSKLEICGQYFDQRERVFHVFGRTHNAPHRFYYRRADRFEGVERLTGEWTAWERLPVDIDSIEDNGKSAQHFFTDNNHGGIHLMPTMWNRRLYLLWPQFRLVPDEEQNKKIPTTFDRVNRWEIKLAWTELWNGSWSPKQVSMSTIASPPVVVNPPPSVVPLEHTETHPTQKITKAWVRVTAWILGEVYYKEVSFTSWEPGHVKNALVDGIGIDITDSKDYGFFKDELYTQSVYSYLPEPEAHLFTVGESSGRLVVTPFVRVSAGALQGKRIETRKMSLTLKQGDRLTFRERTQDAVETLVPWNYRAYTQLGTFLMGACKVRDIETFSTNAALSYNSFLTPAGSYNSFQDCSRPTPLFAKPYFAVDWSEKVVLNKTLLSFRVHGFQSTSGFQHKRPFFFQDRNRVYLVTPMRGLLKVGTATVAKETNPPSASAAVSKGSILATVTADKYAIAPEFMFQLHSDPLVCEFIRRLNAGGLFALLATDTQQIKDSTPPSFVTQYSPSPYVAKPYPDESAPLSFERGGAYSQYHWELFLYAPMRTWSELLKNQQFAEAEAFLKTVANITASGVSPSGAPLSLSERVWQFAPFLTDDGLRIQNALGLLMYTGTDPAKLQDKAKVQATIQDWMGDPFNPHLIARGRITAYKQAVMLECCRHYLAAADFEFGRYTMESIPRALQYLIIVIKVLGPNRPGPVRKPARVAPETYHMLTVKGYLSPFSSFSLALGDLETELPFTHSVPTLAGSTGSTSSIQSMYFCLPPNDEWGRIWDSVADRLFKIRHCMNIDGIVQELPLFPEPIDPRLLVEARAKGLSISSILNDFRGSLPHQDFSIRFEKAMRAVEDLGRFAQRFETLVEKGEAEGLAQMRVEQESAWLKDYLRRELVQAIAHQTKQREAVEKTRASTQARIDYYDAQLNRGLVEDEKLQRSALQVARGFEEKSQGAEVQANVLSMIPQTHAQGAASGTSFGGQQLALAARAFSAFHHAQGTQASHDSSMAALNALWERRRDEWAFLRTQAMLDLQRIDVELLAARIQEDVATLRLENHDKTTANTQAVLDFYRNRFFTADKYSSAAEDLYPDYFALFQLAYQYAREAEACCRFQFGLTDLNVIQFNYWSDAKKGLLAGERLLLALKQLERRYLEVDRREFEIKRDISLVMLDPVAFIELKQTGHCEFEIPESFFDADYPGQFMRRLRGASMTIPCVVGRYTSVNCVLTLLKNKTRVTSDPGAAYEEDLTQPDPRFVTTFAATTQSIATSHAQNDSGLFDTEGRDGRYLPFRGAGVASRWRIDLPIDTNAIDRHSLADILLHFPYTARAGGARLEAAARLAREKALKDANGIPQRRLFMASNESRDAWHRFLHPEPTATAHTLQIDLTCESIALLFRDRAVMVSHVDLYLNFRNQSSNAVYRGGPASLSGSLSQKAGAIATAAIARNLNSIENLTGGTPIGSFPLAFEIKPGVVSALRLDIPEASVSGIDPSLIETPPGSTHVRLKADAIADLWIVVQYNLK